MEINELLGVLATYVGPAMVAGITIWLQYRKNKADIKEIESRAVKTQKEGNFTDGEIFLKWTQEFKVRLDDAEKVNTEITNLVKEQGKVIEESRNKIISLEDIIAKQSVLLVDANARILILEKENLALKENVLLLQNENTLLKSRISELETENAKLKENRNGG